MSGLSAKRTSEILNTLWVWVLHHRGLSYERPMMPRKYAVSLFQVVLHYAFFNPVSEYTVSYSSRILLNT